MAAGKLRIHNRDWFKRTGQRGMQIKSVVSNHSLPVARRAAESWLPLIANNGK